MGELPSPVMREPSEETVNSDCPDVVWKLSEDTVDKVRSDKVVELQRTVGREPSDEIVGSA